MDNVMMCRVTMNVQRLDLDAREQEVAERGIVEFEHEAYNQRAEVVCICRRMAFMRKKQVAQGQPA
jgi:acyl dehydratase